ncbi:MAG: hypothetical protein H5T62_09810 [Anaerolineae bacterium]|nr:hypothetical protein [Anaerolineae bacterium]
MLDSRWLQALLCTVAFVVTIVYLGQTACAGYLGFPLDDAWIHQTYARNLARWGEFAYVRGQLSAGSTAPLWTIVLSVGYLLGVDGRLWAYLVGATCLVWTASIVYRLASLLWSDRVWTASAAAIFCALEWHLIWAAFSGMEILLFISLSLLLMDQAMTGGRPFWIGLLGSLLVLTRPEGIVLFLLVMVFILLPEEERTWHWASVPPVLAGFSLLVVPYLVYNVIVSGALFPNTFYAKQAEYRVLLEGLPLWTRLWRVVRPTLVGAQVLLVPGFIYAVWREVKRLFAARGELALRQLLLPFLPLLWWAAMLGIYALRLPVDYQHGRYLIPTIPLFILYGMTGMGEMLQPGSERAVVRILSQVVLGATGVLLLAFVFMGGMAYTRDVRVIECEMVDVARWLAENTPPEALIAAHDIGAIGYFAERPLLDLAGLITPQVIPFIRDEARLLDFVRERGADYLVTFPSWYPQMVRDPSLEPVYDTGCPWTVALGHDNMAVYRVSSE